MNWKASTLEFLGDVMRFVSRACFIACIILLSAFSVWFVAKFLWHLSDWLNRTMFRAPW